MKKSERLLERIVKIVMVIISLLGCLYVFKINEVNISGSSYQVTLPIKFTIFVIIAAMLTILFIFIRYYKNKLKEKDLCLFHLSILSVVAIELTVTMFLITILVTNNVWNTILCITICKNFKIHV